MGPNETEEPIRFASATLGAKRHVCAFFNSPDEEYRVLLPFIKEGFERGEKAFHIVNPALREEHLRRLKSAGIDLRDLRVLIVDDEPDTREILVMALSQTGAAVRAAATAGEALEVFDEWKPSVLVSDIGMPSEDGYDLIRRVRARDVERGGRIPALALTGYASADDIARALAAGFQTHLAKPVAPDDLVDAVATLVKTLQVT